MKTFRKKRLEIVIEHPLERRVLALLDEQGVSGYTVMPALAGRGHRGAWRQGLSSGAEEKVMIMAVLDEKKAPAIIKAIYDLVGEYVGILLLTDVEVLRPDHF